MSKCKSFSFSQRLRDLREERRLSKSGLARLVGVSTTCVWNWEEGNTEPRSENLHAISEALNVSIDYLEKGEHMERPRQSSSLTIEPEAHELSEVIAAAKVRIAELAGTSPENVRVTIDY